MTGLDIDTRTRRVRAGRAAVRAAHRDAAVRSRSCCASAGCDEMQPRSSARWIRRRPSTRVTPVGHDSAEAARNRHTEPAQLPSSSAGDLDWITMKALEKDRHAALRDGQRLAADVRRHLSDEPVTAGPPSTVYRARKFVRRHRIGVAAAAALAPSCWSLRRRRWRCRRSGLRANAIAPIARRRQPARCPCSWKGLFEVSAPSEAVANSTSARQILDAGAQRIEQSLKGQPEIQATLMSTMERRIAALVSIRAPNPCMTRR